MNYRKFSLPLRYVAAATVLLFGRYLVAPLVSKGKGKKLRWMPAANQRYFTCPSGNLFYVEIVGPANGKPLVFVHGVNADHTQWYYQRRYFENSYLLIFIDLPMHHINFSNHRLDIVTLASDVDWVLSRLNVKDAVLYGHSMGGTVVMEYCLKYPNDRVKALVLHGAPYTDPVYLNSLAPVGKYLRNPVVIPFLGFMKQYPRLFNFLSLVNFLNGLSVLACRYVFFTGRQTAAELLYVTATAPRNDSGAVAESILQLMRYNAIGRLQDLQLPVMIISGKNDHLNNLSSGKYLHQYIKDSRFLVVPGGHQSMVEDHEQINAALSDFLEQVYK